MCGIVVKPVKYSEIGQDLVHRGPDSTVIKYINDYMFKFFRLAIIDISHAGDQPFEDDKFMLVCNGEIYNHEKLRNVYQYPYMSHSDCEVLLPLLAKHSIKNVATIIDAEFAFVAYDKANNKFLAARDSMGIRPLFFGYCEDGKIAFASEIKALIGVCKEILPFPPGHYYDGDEFLPYNELYTINDPKHKNLPEILNNIREKLITSVVKRLDADVPVGFLLSGGLDSSLVCSIATRHLNKQIETFAIGLDHNPIDLKYAQQMADYLGTKHHEVIFNREDIYRELKNVIHAIESWDVTTIRASIPMYLLCKYIREKSNVRVLLSGEVSDELFGYKYTDFAPSAAEFQKESQKRIKELYMYDVLRADRCIAANSLEARVPFSDTDFVSYVMSIDPEIKLNKYNMGKYLLRKAFDLSETNKTEFLPAEILWRDKAAFSDAVGHSMVDNLIALAEAKYTDEEFKEKILRYKVNPPLSKEGLMYREIFAEFFPHQEHVICSYWLPNTSWPNCNLSDPSARHLPNYGMSGD